MGLPQGLARPPLSSNETKNVSVVVAIRFFFIHVIKRPHEKARCNQWSRSRVLVDKLAADRLEQHYWRRGTLLYFGAATCPAATGRSGQLRCAKKYPDRFLFGSDVVAPKSIDSPMAAYNAYEPLWKALKPETVRKVALENYFDEGRRKVRAWEKANASQAQ